MLVGKGVMCAFAIVVVFFYIKICKKNNKLLILPKEILHELHRQPQI